MPKFRVFMFACLLFGAIMVSPGSARAADVAVGIMAGIPNELSIAEQNARLRDYKQAGVRFIRTGIAPNDQGIAIAKHLYDQGIKIDWMVLFQYRPDAPTRVWQPKEFPNMWAGHPLSALDPDRFRTYLQENLDKLEANGVQLAAFDVGNEINWAAFNAEFSVPGESKGVLSLDGLYHDPEGQRVAKGYLQYLKILAVLKDVRDHSRLNRQTPILSAGLVDAEAGDIPSSRRVEAVSFSATLEFMRANGLDKLVDGYGVHVYPNSNPRTPAAQRGARWISGVSSRSVSRRRAPSASRAGSPNGASRTRIPHARRVRKIVPW